MKTLTKQADILIIGGGAAGCYAAITLAEKHPGLSVILADKANIKRSGCLAAGVNALNAYITPGHTPMDYVRYAEKDAEGIVRGDLLLSLAEGFNRVTEKLEQLGLVILKNPDGSYRTRGDRNIKINGENIKPLLAEAATRSKNVMVLNHVNMVDYLQEDGAVSGAWGIDVREERMVFIAASAVICATGGAAGLYLPNHPGSSRHKMWYSPFNTGAGYAMGLRAGAEMTTFEMRFIALRCKGTIAPTGTLAQGIGVAQVNARGEAYQTAYGNTTSERLFAVVSENLAGRGPCYLKTSGITQEEQESLEKAYLNMAPAQTMRWCETKLEPRYYDVEVEGTEPYVVGGHTGSGYWVDEKRQTTLKGLFAAGDVAGGAPQKYVTGALVEGEIAADAAAEFAKDRKTPVLPAETVERKKEWAMHFLQGTSAGANVASRSCADTSPSMGAAASGHLWPSEKLPVYDTDSLEDAMQQAMDEYAGGIKTGYRYTEAGLFQANAHIERIERLSDFLRARDFYGLMKIFELKDRLMVSRALIAHMSARKETRWHSFAENLDHPGKDAAYEKYVNSRLEDGKIKILFRPLVKEGDTA